ncbi:rhomboid family intramembrane serine protease GlpG [Vibrio sp. SCSIO 43136]|uniref:rhomboid family intramembrane serine protease GlpG n=1 Tax=Vibrio sp. SCSIO 43136 TaxID=2819101 RepID=UPI002074D84A|nr:rhomboid family intramembrane serine protease GlpG [Vibrio sp. SCSIO 43136]USD65395.1 rhomboid family intramembrane serine protease GlpG [Vibrio sp. SCSIO 43136]
MQRLFVLDNPRLGQAFIDYMASRQIELNMMPEGGGQFALWLMDDQYLVEAQAELKHFLANPQAAKYQAASWDMAETRTSNFHYQTPSLLKMVKAKAGPLTLLIMVVAMAVFGLQQFGFGREVFTALHFPAYAEQKLELWRWVSHAVLHFSVTHIVFNLLWWWQFGGDIEQKLGSGKLLQLFLLSGAVSGAGQFWFEGANFGGLSGVVYALLGYIWMLTWRAPEKGVIVAKPIVGFMLVWLVLGYAQSFMAIANTAHLLGLLSGIALGLWDTNSTSKRA